MRRCRPRMARRIDCSLRWLCHGILGNARPWEPISRQVGGERLRKTEQGTAFLIYNMYIICIYGSEFLRLSQMCLILHRLICRHPTDPNPRRSNLDRRPRAPLSVDSDEIKPVTLALTNTFPLRLKKKVLCWSEDSQSSNHFKPVWRAFLILQYLATQFVARLPCCRDQHLNC